MDYRACCGGEVGWPGGAGGRNRIWFVRAWDPLLKSDAMLPSMSIAVASNPAEPAVLDRLKLVQAPSSARALDVSPQTKPPGEVVAYEHLLRAIMCLYEGGESCWESALNELTMAIPGSQGLWIEHAPCTHPAPRRGFTSEHFASAYMSGFHLLDPLAGEDRVHHMAASMRPMRIDEVVESCIFERSAFAWSFLAAQGGLAYGLGVCFPVGPGRLARLWLFRPNERNFGDGDIRVLHHFAAQASCLLRQQAEHRKVVSERADAVALLDELDIPYFIVDQDAKLLSTNTAAKRLIGHGPLSLRGDTLGAKSGTEDEGRNPIVELIEEHQSRPGRSRKRGYAVARLRDDSSFRARWFAFAVRLHSTGRGERARYAIIVSDAEKADVRIGIDQLRHLFGFTPTEARVMQALLDGHTTTAIADIMWVRSDTVRTHIKSLLAKTGLRSHTELQKLLMRIVPGFRTD